MAFFLFILVNASLFIRPAEIIPELIGVSIYEYLIISCFLLAIPEIIRFATSSPPSSHPISLCILGVFAAGVLSQFGGGGKPEQAGDIAFYLFKILIYYTLLVSLVRTGSRLRVFLFWLLCFCLGLSVVTTMQYHEMIELPTLKSRLTDVHFDPFTGEETKFDRLQGSGIFQDPNEFCLMMSVGAILCLYQMSRSLLAKLMWLAPLCLFGYSITLTQSRGGFLAFVGGLGVFIWVRYGWRRAVGLACLGLPVVLLMFAGRQTSISATQGTGQQRIQLWSDWMDKFRGNPALGAGMKVPEANGDAEAVEIREALKEDKLLAAHNSFLHAFGELGFFGGMFFLGAFFFAAQGLRRLYRAEITERRMKHVFPYVTAAFGSYVLGLLTLSVCYTIPTYLMLGLAGIVPRVTPHHSNTPPPRFDMAALAQLMGLAVAYLACIYLFVRIFVRWA